MNTDARVSGVSPQGIQTQENKQELKFSLEIINYYSYDFSNDMA